MPGVGFGVGDGVEFFCRRDGAMAELGLHGAARTPAGVRDRFVWRVALTAYLATGMVNSAPLAMLSGQRCMTLL